MPEGSGNEFETKAPNEACARSPATPTGHRRCDQLCPRLAMTDDSFSFVGADDEPSPESDEARRRTIHAPQTDGRFEVSLRGLEVDPETRCTHYDGGHDVVAIRFPCCAAFYPCFVCHEETTDHEAKRWPADRFGAPAVLCGRCDTVLTIRQYLDAEHRCPSCGGGFNPGCVNHHDRYFCVE